MKLPIVSRKEYDDLGKLMDIQANNIRELNEARVRANDNFTNLQRKVREIIPENYSMSGSTIMDLNVYIEDLNDKINEQKKEISRLKSLLTRNGISYKKDEKK